MDENPEAWKLKAKCLGLDPNLFVPSGPGGSLKRVYVICNGGGLESPCPVRVECSHYAVVNGLVGVFGGQMHSQRTSVHIVQDIQDARPRPVAVNGSGFVARIAQDGRKGPKGTPGGTKST